jgi:uncharacterized OsmC-like protein
MSDPNIRDYTIKAGSCDVFGRVILSTRNHHFIIDGPEQNGCPGEALVPGEAFLAAVIACGVEVVQVLGKNGNTPTSAVRGTIRGFLDKSKPVRTDYTVFNWVRLDFEVEGVTQEQAQALVDGFKVRCPLFGTVAVACPDVQVSVKAV